VKFVFGRLSTVLAEQIDIRVFAALVTRAGNEVLDSDF
jgi:hypothetical protein